MKRVAIITLPLIIILLLGIGYWFLSPLWRVEKVNEDFPQITNTNFHQNSGGNGEGQNVFDTSIDESLQVLKEGVFIGFDKRHSGEGTARILKIEDKYILRFEDDFRVINGPDLFVGFGNDGEYDRESQLAPLKGNVGSQNYELPPTFDPDQHSEVWIWCRAFSVPFAKATLGEPHF